MFADADLAAGPDQALPLVWILTQLPSQQNFDAPLKEIARRGVVGTDRLGLRATPPAVEPGGKYAGVVEHEKVVGPQKAGKVAEDEVLGSSGLPIQVEHPRSAAVGQSLLGDLPRRKVVVEVGYLHARPDYRGLRGCVAVLTTRAGRSKPAGNRFASARIWIVGTGERAVP